MQYTNHYILIKILQRFFECCAFLIYAFLSHPGTCNRNLQVNSARRVNSLSPLKTSTVIKTVWHVEHKSRGGGNDWFSCHNGKYLQKWAHYTRFQNYNIYSQLLEFSGWLCKHMDLSAIDRKWNSRDVAKSPCKISWMEYTAKYFCSSVINVTCTFHGEASWQKQSRC